MIFADETYDSNGLVERIEYDTTAHTVTTTVPPAAPETREMTDEEVITFDARERYATTVTNTLQMKVESDTSVDKLVAVIEALNAITDMTNAAINANPAAVIKTLTRECKTIARQVNREARMTSGRTEDTDTGPVTDV